MRLTSLLLSALFVGSACGGGAVPSASPTTTVPITSLPVATTSAPTTSTLPAPPLPRFPAELPDDFEAVFSRDGGSMPWFEVLEVSADNAAYDVYIDGTTIGIGLTPDPSRIASLYDEIVLGDFDLYEVDSADGAVAVSGQESTSWRVMAGGETHSLAISGGEIISPDNSRSPLVALRTFADSEGRSFDHSLDVIIDETLRDDPRYEFWLDLAGHDVGIGPIRDDDRITIFWSGEVEMVDIEITGDGGSRRVVGIPFEPGGDLLLSMHGGEPKAAAPGYVEYTFALTDGAAIDAATAARQVGAALRSVHGSVVEERVESETFTLRVPGGAPLTNELMVALAEPNDLLEFRPLLTERANGLGGDSGAVVVDAGAIESASVQIDGGVGDSLALVLRAGSPGIDDFNLLAAECVERVPSCPLGRIAIVSVGEVLAGPRAPSGSMGRDQIVLAGAFSESEAAALATALNEIPMLAKVDLISAQIVT